MCGRYYIEIDDREIEEITRKIQEKLREEESQFTIKMSGEIFPTDTVPVQVGADSFVPMKWGFTAFDGGLLINARSETVLEKKMFADSMRERRCVIPASGYFEWQKNAPESVRDANTSGVLSGFDTAHQNSKRKAEKLKYRFYVPNKTIHLAACWRLENEQPVFVILTRDAIKGAERIHKRMPVIIPQSRVSEWIHDSPEVMRESVTELELEAVA